MRYRQNVLQGALFILLSEFMFAAMGATVKHLSSTLSHEMIVFMRNCAGLLVILPLFLRMAHKESFYTEVPWLHLQRALLGLSAMYCFFYAIGNMPLAKSVLLKTTAPLFMPLIAFLWLQESLSKYSIAAVVIGFLGVYLILDPGGQYTWIALIGLLGGLFAALAKVTVRRLSRTEPAVRTVVYFSLVATLVSAIPLSWGWRTPNLSEWSWIVMMGVCGTAGQLFLTRGYSAAKAGQIAPFTYFSVVYAALLGYLLWDETLKAIFYLGAFLIILAGIMTVYSPKQRREVI